MPFKSSGDRIRPKPLVNIRNHAANLRFAYRHDMSLKFDSGIELIVKSIASSTFLIICHLQFIYSLTCLLNSRLLILLSVLHYDYADFRREIAKTDITSAVGVCSTSTFPVSFNT